MLSFRSAPENKSTLRETSATALEWTRLRDHLAGRTQSPLGRAHVLLLEPSRDLQTIERAQQLTAELRIFLAAGGSFGFGGLFDASALLDKARIPGAALEPLELRRIAELAEHIADWRVLVAEPPDYIEGKWPAVTALSEPVLLTNFYKLLQLVSGKIDPDGTLSDDASPELARIRKAMERQHKQIQDSLRRQLRAVSDAGGAQEDLITVRGDRFVIPVKAEFRRRVPGVVHGSSSSGQTVFVEPMETIEQNNELVRLLDEELAEIHRILVSMTEAVGEQAGSIARGTEVLAEVEAHYAYAKFAEALDCVRPVFTDGKPHGEEAALSLEQARHPLLDLRMRSENPLMRDGAAHERGTQARGPLRIVPLTLGLPGVSKQLIISGPNTGGKTVALKTVGLLALMAQAGLPVPAASARLPIFSAVYADIGDAQSIERNLSTFSAHISHVNQIAREADARSLVLLDELGSATDPEEGAALAVAIAERFLTMGAWSMITTHLTSLKIYAAKHGGGVVNAAVGFDERTLAPTYELRMGVPGASSGINIAERLGLDAGMIRDARASVTTQSADIARFLDDLHTQLTAVAKERADIRLREQAVERERQRLESEGKLEQRQRARELEVKLASLMKEFEFQMRDSIKGMEDKTAQRKASAEADRRVARLKREFQESFNQAVVAHVSGADKKDPAAQPHVVRSVGAGDMVLLKSMGREAKVERTLDNGGYEVSIGPMKMRVPKDDIAKVTISAPKQSPIQAATKRGISVQAREPDTVPGEINVIGRTADEARDEVERFLDQAFLAGRPSIRVVHGTGMGILRRTLRDYLKRHPHVVSVTEPPYNEGGQGATLVELKA